MTPRPFLRRTPTMIGVSLLLHVAFVGIALQRANRPREDLAWPPIPSEPLGPGRTPPPQEPATIEVIILDEPEIRTAVTTPAAPAPEVPEAAPVSRTAPRHAPPTATLRPEPARPQDAPSTAPAAPIPETTAPAPRSAFAMRAPGETPGVDVSPERVAAGAITAPPAPGAPSGLQALAETPRDIAKNELDRQRDGTYRAKQDNFTARVDKDGKVRFDDRGVIRPGNGIDPAGPSTALDGSMQQDGSIGAGGVGGSMDVTDMIMRGKGQDPHAHEKLAFLDRTREQRATIAQDHRANQLSKSAVLMRRTLDEMWASTRDLTERKETLFELWDECAETGDPEMVAGALQARAEIMTFIRSRLRGPHAYTREEVAQLNARKKSKATFAPPSAG